MEECFRVRRELPQDLPIVRRINERAFARANEADLVDRLRAHCPEITSLVAESIQSGVIAHAIFSPVRIECDDGRSIIGAALGPIAVLPEYQRRGAGSALIRAGIEQLDSSGCPFVVVLGHPEYYPRFGFVPAMSKHGIASEWNVRDDVFMIRILNAGEMPGARGVAKYHPEFASV